MVTIGHLTSVLVENPAGKLNPLKLLPFPLPTPSSDGGTLGDIISWNHNLLKNPYNHNKINKRVYKREFYPQKDIH